MIEFSKEAETELQSSVSGSPKHIALSKIAKIKCPAGWRLVRQGRKLTGWYITGPMGNLLYQGNLDNIQGFLEGWASYPAWQ